MNYFPNNNVNPNNFYPQYKRYNNYSPQSSYLSPKQYARQQSNDYYFDEDAPNYGKKYSNSPKKSPVANKNVYYRDRDYNLPNPLSTANYYYRNGVYTSPTDNYNLNNNNPLKNWNTYCGCGLNRDNMRY